MRLPLRALGFLVASLAVPTVAFASAAAVAPGTIGAARITVPRCGTAGLSVLQNLSGTTVVSVTVSNLPSGCGGAAIQVALNTGSSSATGSSTVPAGGGSVTVSLSSTPAVATIESTDLVLIGP